MEDEIANRTKKANKICEIKSEKTRNKTVQETLQQSILRQIEIKQTRIEFINNVAQIRRIGKRRKGRTNRYSTSDRSIENPNDQKASKKWVKH